MNTRTIATYSALCLALFAIAQNKAVLTVDELLKAAKKYDAKVVQVRGKLVKFELKTSKKGNKYTVGQIVGMDVKKPVNVYQKGHPDSKLQLKSGAYVIVTGTYKIEKKVGSDVYKNEIDASPVKGAKTGIEVMKGTKPGRSSETIGH